MSIDTFEAHKFYMTNNISLSEAAQKFGITGPSLRKRFVKENLPTKTRNETRKKKISQSLLRDMYLNRKLSIEEIAKILNVSRGTIHNRITKLKINKSPEESRADRYSSYDVWTKTDDIIGRKLLSETLDYSVVAKKLNRSMCSIENRNRFWKIDLSSNSTLFGIPTIAKDGNQYRSRFEARVADFLFEKNIRYNYEVYICKYKMWTCDFLVNGIWIEVDGLGKYRKNTGSTNYSDNHEKIKYYKEHGFNYVILKKSTWKKQLMDVLGLC